MLRLGDRGTIWTREQTEDNDALDEIKWKRALARHVMRGCE